MEPNNLRDLQNLTNQILSESTQAEEHFMNSWPYTAPYLSEEAHVEEKELVNEYNRGTAVDRGGETAQIELRRRAQRNAQNKAGARGPELTHGGPKPLSNSKTIGSSTPRGPEFTRPNSTRSHPGAPGGSSGFGWNRLRKEEADLFDVLSEFLVSEGYSEQESLEMMVIMTEEQRNQILEGIIGQAADGIARTIGTMVGTGQRAVREVPGYLKQKAKNVKGTFDSARERASSNNPDVRSGRKVPTFGGRRPSSVPPNVRRYAGGG